MICCKHFRFMNILKLESHLKNQHKIALESKELEFDTWKEFCEWKEEEEKSTHSWYVQKCAPQQRQDNKHWYFYCNRAGKYEPRGESQKCIKSQGTSKAVHHCSAYIKATHSITTNKVFVRYNGTHYNHEKQLGHLRIDSQTRNVIASKLQQGVCSQRILDDMREITETSAISRKHLITRKDICNIQRQFNIEGIRKHPNDMISVSSWVEEMEVLEYNPVLLFKQQGEMPFEACEGLKPQDFLLVLQTEFQKDMLCANVCKGVCIDTTYKINDYEFNLITIMVLDDFQEGIPVMWALSSREDKVALVSSGSRGGHRGHVPPRSRGMRACASHCHV